MNLLIIDDEVLTVKSLKENMPWKSLGIDEVYTAFEPRFAKQLVLTFPINVILCDIEMPGENGIDFIKWMRANTDCDAEVLLLTCHDEFTYAKEAISLGVMEYLLKPIAYDELGEIIKKAIAKYNDRQVQKKQIEDGKMWQQNLTSIERSFWQECFFNKNYDADLLEHAALGFTKQSDFLLITMRILGTANALSSNNIFTLIEKQAADIFGSLSLSMSVFAPSEKYIYIIANKNEMDPDNTEQIFNYFKEMLFSLQINQINIKGCMGDFCKISEIVKTEDLLISFLNNIDDNSGFFMLNADDSLTLSLDNANTDKIFQDVSNFIKRHLTDDITRQDVADSVHLNVDYLSKLFKKKTNVTLTEFIRKERLNYSKHLLKTSTMSINDIAMLLNFSSQSHFSSAFKKQYQCSPADYRNEK